jgi:hypothetical protein
LDTEARDERSTRFSCILAKARRILVLFGTRLQLRVIGMKLQGALEQRRFGFDSIRVWDATLDGANGLAGLLLVKSNTFSAKVRVDDVDIVTF